MIQPSEIDNAEVDRLARFIASNGREGAAPDWFRLFSLAVKCNASVWDVEEALATYDRSMDRATRREWLRRGMVVMFAEAEAGRMQRELINRTSNTISIAHRLPS